MRTHRSFTLSYIHVHSHTHTHVNSNTHSRTLAHRSFTLSHMPHLRNRYGQTGSGKTFTLTGGAERYVDRGLIPRTLAMIYGEFAKRGDTQFQAYISYLELYNEQGYDLLSDSDSGTSSLEDLPKVTLREDDDGNVHLRNLTPHVANNEEEALNLLFLGDTNRAVAETPMNMASSRSHCIFTISLEMREAGSDLIKRSKLHLVDLAGSERVHKTNASGQILREAKYINTSLHYLEMVIVALHERNTKGRTHIPYVDEGGRGVGRGRHRRRE